MSNFSLLSMLMTCDAICLLSKKRLLNITCHLLYQYYQLRNVTYLLSMNCIVYTSYQLRGTTFLPSTKVISHLVQSFTFYKSYQLRGTIVLPSTQVINYVVQSFYLLNKLLATWYNLSTAFTSYQPRGKIVVPSTQVISHVVPFVCFLTYFFSHLINAFNLLSKPRLLDICKTFEHDQLLASVVPVHLCLVFAQLITAMYICVCRTATMYRSCMTPVHSILEE